MTTMKSLAACVVDAANCSSNAHILSCGDAQPGDQRCLPGQSTQQAFMGISTGFFTESRGVVRRLNRNGQPKPVARKSSLVPSPFRPSAPARR